jgi:oxygen-independent coproporphyrinogen-3 oxidase
MAPRAAYVHVPFCAHRCGYCNFTLIAGRDDLIESYLQAIECEISWLKHAQEVDTLFFGGGTPTHLPSEQLERLFAIVRRWIRLAPGYELSVEANPIDLTPDRIELLAELGVTRLSIGGQSFFADKLKLLERDHTPDQLSQSIREATAKISSVSNDLIFGAPNETCSQWQEDLRQTIALGPQHISTYGLTFEQGTTFWSRRERGELRPLGEEHERELYALAIHELTAAGYEHYEVSNFARPGHRCRHNETYWAGDEYFAFGPGAARYIDGRREMNHRSTTTWLKRVLGGQSAVAESEELPPEDRAREMLVFGLRRMAGVERVRFAARTGYTVDALVGEPLRKFVAEGLLADDGTTIKLTREGLFVSDAIWPYFLRK